MSALGEAQRNVDRRQSAADQQQRLRGIHIGEGIQRPGIRNEESAIVQPSIGAARGARWQVAHGEDDDICRNLTAIGQQHPAIVRKQTHHLATHTAQAHQRLAVECLIDAFLYIIAEQPSRHIGSSKIESAFHQCVGDRAAAALKPFGKARFETNLHPADRHIEQVIGPACAVGHPAAEVFFRLRNDDAPVRAAPVQLESEDGAAESTADDNDCFASSLFFHSTGSCAFKTNYKACADTATVRLRHSSITPARGKAKCEGHSPVSSSST